MSNPSSRGFMGTLSKMIDRQLYGSTKPLELLLRAPGAGALLGIEYGLNHFAWYVAMPLLPLFMVLCCAGVTCFTIYQVFFFTKHACVEKEFSAKGVLYSLFFWASYVFALPIWLLYRFLSYVFPFTIKTVPITPYAHEGEAL